MSKRNSASLLRKLLGTSLLASLFAEQAKSPAPPTRSDRTVIESILIERETIRRDLEETARSGHVPAKALASRLEASHRHQLAEDMRQLDFRRRELASTLRQLDAMFPEQLPPEPEAEPAPIHRPRNFRRLGEMWGPKPGKPTRH